MWRKALLVLTLILLVSSASHASSQEEALEELRRLKIPVDADEFIRCAKHGNSKAVELFLSSGMDPDTRGRTGVTALFLAAEEGHTEIAGILLSHGANVNAQASYGLTPLIGAARRGHTDTVKAP